MWELRYSRDSFSIEAAVAKDRPLPQWYLEEPPTDSIGQFYMKAFRDLSTCRSIGMSLGPISWTDILAYAHHCGMDEEASEIFIYMIRQMDQAYITWIDQQQEARKEKPKARGKDG